MHDHENTEKPTEIYEQEVKKGHPSPLLENTTHYPFCSTPLPPSPVGTLPALSPPPLGAILLAVQSPVHRSEDAFQNALAIQPHPAVPPPGNRIHNIPHAIPQLGQAIVQLPQRLRRAPLLADLEKLNPHLPRGSVPLVELLRRIDHHALDVIAGDAVGDDDDIQRLDGLGAAFGFDVAEVGFQDGVQAGPRRGAAHGADGLENALDVGAGGDVLVFDVVPVVEEEDVDAVGVVGGADRGYGGQGLRGFAPGAAGHAAAVVDEEDGVEGGEEGVGVVDRGGVGVGVGV